MKASDKSKVYSPGRKGGCETCCEREDYFIRIILPDTAKEKPQGGGVKVGPGRATEDGKGRVPMEIKKGDRVIYSKFAGTEYKVGDDEYLILRESDILAKISS